MHRRLAVILVILGGCAKAGSEDHCVPGERRCVGRAAQLCVDVGEWGPPEYCPEGAECRDGACVSTCDDACTPGERRCVPAGVQTCDPGPDGCARWSEPSPCIAGAECVDGRCRDGCPIRCEEGEARCVGPDAYTECERGARCPRWSAPVDCAEGEQCSGGRCVPAGACADQCAEGEADCLDEATEQRCDVDPAGCLDWAAPVECAEGAECRPGEGCVAACADECELGEARCAEGGRQTCIRDADDCLVWGAVEACPDGTACTDGGCAGGCEDACELGARRCAADGVSVETCVREGGCAVWGAPLPCEGGAACVGEGDCGVCPPGEAEQRACGYCGEQRRTCGDDGQWTDWGACEGQGECEPGAEEACGTCGTRRCGDDCRWGACEERGACRPGETRPCGNCGTQRCNAQCEWGACEGQGECAPGSTGACGECGMRTCGADCRWGGCNNGDGTTWRHCNQCGWQFCCPNGNWCPCDARFPDRCGGRQCVGAGYCQ